jgi:hypothetical protein
MSSRNTYCIFISFLGTFLEAIKKERFSVDSYGFDSRAQGKVEEFSSAPDPEFAKPRNRFQGINSARLGIDSWAP